MMQVQNPAVLFEGTGSYLKSGALILLEKHHGCCLQGGSVDEYLSLMPVTDFFLED